MKPAKGIMPYAAKFVPYDDTRVTVHITAGAGQAGQHGAKLVTRLCHGVAKFVPNLCHMLPYDAKVKKKLVKSQRHP